MASPASGLLIAPVLARALSADGRGELAAATAPLLLFGTIFTLGLPEAALHFTAKYPALRAHFTRRLLPRLLVCGVLATIGACIFALFVAGTSREVQVLTCIAALAIPGTLVLSLLRGAASGAHDWRAVNLEKYVNAAVRVIGIYGLHAAGYLTVPSAVAVIAFGPLLGFAAYLIARRRHDAGRAETVVTPQGPSTSVLTHYGRRVWVGSLSGYILGRLDQLLMVRLTSSTELGYYAAGVSISDGIAAFNGAVRDVIFAATSGGEDHRKTAAAARLSLLVSVVIAAPVAITCPWWFPEVFGSDFRGGSTAAIVLIGSAVAGVPGTIAGAILSGLGHPELRSRSLIVAAVVNVIAVMCLTAPFGANGVAWASVLGAFVAANGNIYYLVRRFGFTVADFYLARRSDVALLTKMIGS